MIVTVTLNASLRVAYEAERVNWGAPNRVTRARHQAGGRGLAVARVLRALGHDVVAAGLAGGTAGELITADLARSGVATRFTRISGESRRTLEVADAGRKHTTFLNEPPPYITTEELGRRLRRPCGPGCLRDAALRSGRAVDHPASSMITEYPPGPFARNIP